MPDKQHEGLKLLKDIRSINKMIEELNLQIKELYSKMTSTTITPKEVNVQSSGNPDPLGDAMAVYVEYEKQLQDYQLELCKKKMIAIKVIKEMSIDCQTIIILKYFKGKTIDKISEEIGYSWRWTWEKTHEAEQEFIGIYEKST